MADSDFVVRDSEEEDRPRTRLVRWSVGWTEPPAQHRLWAGFSAEEWVSRHFFREFVAEVDGMIAARVGLEAFCPPFAEISDLSVRPEFRRAGLGRTLTQKCLVEAAKRNFVAVFLQTELDNSAAHHLYRGMDFFPATQGKMLRMVRFVDYPLLASFRHAYPLNQYRCTPLSDAPNRCLMEWSAYVKESYLRLELTGGATKSESDGVAPALRAFDWRSAEEERGLEVAFDSEPLHDIEPEHYVELTIRARNHGKRTEAGIFEMILPPGVRVSSPRTNQKKVFQWELAPGEELVQAVEVQIEADFDTSVLWYLNYGSLPISMETYWSGNRALLSTSLPMAIPPPTE